MSGCRRMRAGIADNSLPNTSDVTLPFERGVGVYRRLGRRVCVGIVAWLLALLAIQGATVTNLPSIAKKGLQVQMVDDALALGVRHAALNFNLAQLVDVAGDTNNPAWGLGGKVRRFQRGYIAQLDREIRTLSDAGVTVTLILLCYESGNPALDAVLLHPKYDRACPNHLSAFNTRTPEGRGWFVAAMEFMADRWGRGDMGYGRVDNWIVGNEVNSHWFWANMGRVGMEEFADDYLETVRLVHDAVRRHAPDSRIYLSLEHHWSIRYPGGDAGQAFPGWPFLQYFRRKAAEGGDFEWHIAFHPYPENLFEPRFWRDKSATGDVETTPRITFKNIELLPELLRRPEWRFDGRVRRILLSEQGFHTPDGPEGERIQAAAWCYAWNKIERLDGIDAFILHRHVDHGQEGGLRLGLWARDSQAASPAQPSRRKAIYDVFKASGTSRWEEAFAFALPVIGWTNWPDRPGGGQK